MRRLLDGHREIDVRLLTLAAEHVVGCNQQPDDERPGVSRRPLAKQVTPQVLLHLDVVPVV